MSRFPQRVVDAAHGVPFVKLTKFGEMVKHHIKYMNNVSEFVNFDKYFIIPIHVYFILSITNETFSITNGGTPKAASPTNVQQMSHNCNGAVEAYCVRLSLSEQGRIVEKEIHILSETYEAVEVNKYVVMPNHLHMIIVISDSGRTQFAPTISRIVKQFKGSITKQIGFSMWQRSYYDHIIRNDEEYQKIWEYIDTNPLNWEIDKYCK
jgi:REP element-mobilizing transposase RayT